jgi:CheY-like chemotaxis protein
MGRQQPPVPSELLVGVHVLVVDDNADARDLFRTILEYAGALVSVASTAEQALRFFDHVVPDVLVSDISMPEHDGYWLIRELRARAREQGGFVPAVAVTALSGERPSQVLGAGFQVHLRKPVDPWELCRTVDTLARQRQGS